MHRNTNNGDNAIEQEMQKIVPKVLHYCIKHLRGDIKVNSSERKTRFSCGKRILSEESAFQETHTAMTTEEATKSPQNAIFELNPSRQVTMP